LLEILKKDIIGHEIIMDDKSDRHSPVAASLEYWDEFQMEKLDKVAHEIVEIQEISLSERKKLAEETKKWKQLEEAAKLSGMVSLLRSYQKEVDRLSTRAKQSEEAFLEVFQVVSQVPSVEEAKIALREILALADSAGRLELANKKLIHEIEGYKADFKEISSQELTVRKQEDLIAQYEQDLKRLSTEGALEAEKKVENRFTEELERQAHTIAQLRLDLKKANESATASLRDRDIVHSQLMNFESRHNREMEAKQAEVDMLASEIESLSHTLAEQRTTLQIASEKSSSSSTSRSLSSNLAIGTPSKLNRSFENSDADFDIERDLQISHLTSQVQELSNALENQRQTSLKESTEQETTILELNRLLSTLPTPEVWAQLQQRISVLEALQAYLDVGNNEIAQGVDAILREKIRKLERANLEFKASVTLLKQQLADSNASKQLLEQIIAEKDAHIARLEENISTSRATPSSSLDAPSASSENTDSVTQVLMTQRDRLKARVEGLEAEKDAANEKLRLALVKTTSLQEDNVSLYQKLRYLQSYQTGMGAATSSHATSRASSNVSVSPSVLGDIESGKNISVEDKYKSIYEEQVNPFAAFNDREKTKRVENLNPVERFIFSTTSFFLATKNTRMILFGYLALLHLIVMFISYRSAASNSKCNARAEE
jgi:homeobox protein cut-like